DDKCRVFGSRGFCIIGRRLAREGSVEIGSTRGPPAYAEDRFEVWKTLADARELGRAFPVGDHRYRPSIAEPGLERLLAKEREERYRDGTHFEDGDMAVGSLRRLGEHNANAIALPSAMGLQKMGRCVREAAQCAKGDRFGRPILGNCDQSGPLRLD